MRHVADNLPITREQAAAVPAERLERPKHKASARARQLWDRLSDWYGVRFADQYGDEPSRDWCGIVDRTTPQEIIRVLTLIRRRHVTFPPTLPEFAALVKEVREEQALGPRKASTEELLTDFVVKHRTLTQQQMLGPAWSYLYRGTPDGGVICTGVEIAKCDAPAGFRVMVEDMNAASTEL